MRPRVELGSPLRCFLLEIGQSTALTFFLLVPTAQSVLINVINCAPCFYCNPADKSTAVELGFGMNIGNWVLV